ncbi:hypothetical protein GCM10019016_030740 [Streptomyces prasinosporus]|uniref:Uncharacterized protein n=1 Tax=Streptomyces prasinosporus TaxID=68256 RepID=A0ABP6TN92_9ACTN
MPSPPRLDARSYIKAAGEAGKGKWDVARGALPGGAWQLARLLRSPCPRRSQEQDEAYS